MAARRKATRRRARPSASASPARSEPAAKQPDVVESAAAPPPLMAVVDVGSRALRMTVGELGRDGNTRRLETLLAPVAIGHDTFIRGRIRAATTEAVVRTLNDFVAVVRGYGLDVGDIWTVATTAVRDARNRDVFLERVHQQTGLQVEVLEAIEETRLAYQLLRDIVGERFLTGGNLLLALGAGGTQIVLQRDGVVELAETRRLGLMRLVQQHGSPDGRVSTTVRAFLRKAIGSIGRAHDLKDVAEIYVINSDIHQVSTSVGRPRKIDCGVELSCAALDELNKRLTARSDDQLVKRHRLDHATVESARLALCELEAFRELTPALETVVLPESTMLDSLLLDRRLAIEGETAGTPVGADACEAAAWAVARRYRINAEHAAKVRDLALELFAGLREYSTLSERARTMLAVASILHDIGIYVSTTGHEEHGYYLVRNSQIMGLSRSEVERVALIVRFHRRSMPTTNSPELSTLRTAHRVEVLKLAGLLRIADALDADDRQLVERVSVEMSPEAMHVRAHTRVRDREGFVAVRRAFRDKSDLCVELFGVKAKLTEVLAT